ncbi:uncharacterized protein PHALS_03040 [Plasmopara halstedii]|uniref:Uncharacterized protein n=1 Tax=Plasmopara halstedii TaxID=4781 RepID=A0A0P1A7A8_PLAHL|nr:uncharacterized protein PHALS_03040 [Plasmopara halstedii]CEG36492.1 hypothetical protein PHALS_03040 [Plasmopara halstedii]|eukprot:XP_024572861.1 hypothetical protein PHALS_03040 [Plasmopara halstedii]
MKHGLDQHLDSRYDLILCSARTDFGDLLSKTIDFMWKDGVFHDTVIGHKRSQFLSSEIAKSLWQTWMVAAAISYVFQIM